MMAPNNPIGRGGSLRLSRILAGAVLAVTVGIGATGVAFADTTTPTTAAHHFSCPAARARLDQIKGRDAVIDARLAMMEARYDQLVAAGNTARAAMLKSRL